MNPPHEPYLRRAIALSRTAALERCTGGVFGAVLVKDGVIVAEGMNQVVARKDPTWHAEMEALRSGSAALGTFKLTGCTLYASGEPCPMCLAAAYWAGIDRVVFASTVGDALTYGGFDDAFIYEDLRREPGDRRLPVEGPYLREEALTVWRAYAAKSDRVPY